MWCAALLIHKYARDNDVAELGDGMGLSTDCLLLL